MVVGGGWGGDLRSCIDFFLYFIIVIFILILLLILARIERLKQLSLQNQNPFEQKLTLQL